MFCRFFMFLNFKILIGVQNSSQIYLTPVDLRNRDSGSCHTLISIGANPNLAPTTHNEIEFSTDPESVNPTNFDIIIELSFFSNPGRPYRSEFALLGMPQAAQNTSLAFLL